MLFSHILLDLSLIMLYNMVMNASKNNTISGIWDELNQGIFPWVDDNIGELDDKHRLFMAVCEAVINPREFDYAKWKGNGRPPCSRLKIFKAFLLKAVLNVKDTKEFLRMIRAEPLSRRLCGWDSPGLVPSASEFSRVFGEFAERGFTDKWFAEMIVKYHGDTPVETVSYDSAPVEVRTRAANVKRRLARIDPDQPPPPSPITIQGARAAEVNMAELPVECEWGCKRDSQGKKKQWKGGKIHAAVTRDGVPIAVKYTSASMHDSQAMIPLAQLAAARVPHLFDLADAAYDAEPIRAACAELGTVAVIDANPRRSAGTRAMGELEREVYKDRSAAERFFSHLLESHGGRTVRVRAPKKVALHLLLGAIVVAVEQMLRMLC